MIIPNSCVLPELFMFCHDNRNQKGSQKNRSDKLVSEVSEMTMKIKPQERKSVLDLTESAFLVNQSNLAVLAAASVPSQVEMQSLHKQVQKFITSLFLSLPFNHHISSNSSFYPLACPSCSITSNWQTQ